MESTAPLVSVIMPAYNHARYIRQTVASIMAQTYPHIEFLVIDDGSSDNTLEELKRLKSSCEKRFVRSIIQTQPNSGTCLTLNKLLDMARGEYIYSLGSDDLLKPQAIAVLLDFLHTHREYVMAVGDNEIIDSDSRRIGWDAQRRGVPLEQATYKTLAAFTMHKDKDFLTSHFGTYASLVPGNYIPNGYLVRTAALRDTGGYVKEAPLEDWYMMLQLAKRGKFKLINEVLYSYRWHEKNTSQDIAHMQKMTWKTLAYEQKLVQQPEYIQYRVFWEEIWYRHKMKINLGKFLKFYNRQSNCKKQYILEIFGKPFILLEHKL